MVATALLLLSVNAAPPADAATALAIRFGPTARAMAWARPQRSGTCDDSWCWFIGGGGGLGLGLSPRRSGFFGFDLDGEMGQLDPSLFTMGASAFVLYRALPALTVGAGGGVSLVVGHLFGAAPWLGARGRFEFRTDHPDVLLHVSPELRVPLAPRGGVAFVVSFGFDWLWTFGPPRSPAGRPARQG